MEINFRSAFKVALIYFFFSLLWIVLSDQILLLFFSDVESYQFYSSAKGAFFIVVSSVIIYFLVRHEIILLRTAQNSYNILSTHDSLTSLLNRKVFDEDLEVHNASQQEYTLVLTDINGLKMINEAYGSTTGDEVIIRFAELLREIDCSCKSYRIGGDEFCTIFEHQDVSKVHAIFDTISNTMAKTTLHNINVTISTGVAVKSEFSSIYEALTYAEDMLLKNKLLQSTSSSNALITSLLKTLYEHSDETESHAKRIADLCTDMAVVLGMDRAAIDEMKLFALLHDIGKVGIEDRILNKPGALTPQEFSKMKQHSAIGYRIAKSTIQLQSIANYIFSHHERWDGTGYPRGISATDIPIQSRILAIVDAFDAMTNDRIYREAMSIEEAYEELMSNKGSQFDPKLVDIFIDIKNGITNP